jgi:sulfoxide reductase heme-binding subunit YedZ
MRLNAWGVVLLLASMGLLVVVATDQIAPASDPYQAQMRLWLAGRATGLTAYALITIQVVLGLVLSHPINKTSWQLSRRIFPWHENLWVFVLAFLAAHVVSIVLDPYAGVGLDGALIPGLSSFRSAPVAAGTLALYAILVTGLTARYTRLLPFGAWLLIHRLALAIFALAWIHGVTSGTDSGPLVILYVISGMAVLAAVAYRYWVSRQRRPTFATSLERPIEPGGGPSSPIVKEAS